MKMLPRLPGQNSLYDRLFGAKQRRDLVLGVGTLHGQHSQDLGLSESAAAIAFSASKTCWLAMRPVLLSKRKPTFPDGITRVVTSRADEQMVWSHTERVVAAMQDKQSRWDCAVGKLVGHSMGALQSPLVVEESIGRLQALLASALPYPTHIGFLDLQPEAFHMANYATQRPYY